MTDSKNEVLPRFELGSLDSESRVLTVTPQNQPCEPCTLILALFLHKKGQIGQICLVWAAMELSKFLQPGTHQHLLFSYKNHSRPIWDLNPWPSDVSEKFSAVKVWCSTDWAKAGEHCSPTSGELEKGGGRRGKGGRKRKYV